MSVIDVEKLLQGVSGESPAGENLEYDTAFAEMQRLARGKPEQRMGDAVVEAEEPNWREVKSKAIELMALTKDLRVGVELARALLNSDGFSGFSDGLEVIKGLLERYWDSVHPQLDPDDGNDPTMRVNTLVALSNGDTVLRTVRESPLVSSVGHGNFSLRDVLIATGRLSVPASEGSPPEISAIDAAFGAVDLDVLQTTTDALGRSIDHVGSIEGLLTEKVGTGHAADFSALSDLLKQAQKTVLERLSRRGAATPTEATEDAASGAVVATTAAAVSASGEIRTRDEAVKALDKVCAYFTKHEPSSPVPLLLRRAQRLVSKTFVEIVRDLAPDGLSQVEGIRGPSGEES